MRMIDVSDEYDCVLWALVHFALAAAQEMNMRKLQLKGDHLNVVSSPQR